MELSNWVEQRGSADVAENVLQYAYQGVVGQYGCAESDSIVHRQSS